MGQGVGGGSSALTGDVPAAAPLLLSRLLNCQCQAGCRQEGSSFCCCAASVWQSRACCLSMSHDSSIEAPWDWGQYSHPSWHAGQCLAGGRLRGLVQSVALCSCSVLSLGASVSDQVKKAETNRPMCSPVTGQVSPEGCSGPELQGAAAPLPALRGQVGCSLAGRQALHPWTGVREDGLQEGSCSVKSCCVSLEGMGLQYHPVSLAQ